MSPTPDPAAPGADLEALIEANDLDGLIRRIEVLCQDADWDGLRRLRDRCRAASGSGRQLWPAANHAEHRLALEADGAHAGPIVSAAGAQFAIGPLTEVAASSHTWEELSPHLERGPARSLVAYERVLRGEDLRSDRSIDTSVFDLPLALTPWEPPYPVATYEAWRGIFPPPRPLPPLRPMALPVDARPFADPASTDALAELTRPWTTESNGRADAVGAWPPAASTPGGPSPRSPDGPTTGRRGPTRWASHCVTWPSSPGTPTRASSVGRSGWR
jgi:hypothetical protein